MEIEEQIHRARCACDSDTREPYEFECLKDPTTGGVVVMLRASDGGVITYATDYSVPPPRVFVLESPGKDGEVVAEDLAGEEVAYPARFSVDPELAFEAIADFGSSYCLSENFPWVPFE